MLIQTKPKEAGMPVDAVQFLGDPSVHPGIFLDTDPHTKPHWRVRTSEDRGSLWLGVGDWIVGMGHNLRTIHPEDFESDWQLVHNAGGNSPPRDED